jgi:hypothetical protein
MGNYCTRWRPCIKGLSLEGGRADFSKNHDATLPFIKIYRMSILSAGSISLNSTFEKGGASFRGLSLKINALSICLYDLVCWVV